MNIKKRNVVTAIILSIVTFGIYGIYWLVKMTDEMKDAAYDDQLASGAKLVILIIITCGIYGLYWAYKMGKLSAIANARYGLPAKDNSTLYLILEIFGLRIFNYILIQNDLNAFADMPSGPVGPQPTPGYGMPNGQPMGPQPTPGYGMPNGQPMGPQPTSGYGMSNGQPMGPQPNPGYGMSNGQPMGPQPNPGYGMSNGQPMGPQPTPGYGTPAQQPNVPNYGTQQPTQSTPNYGEQANGSVNSDQTNNPFNQ